MAREESGILNVLPIENLVSIGVPALAMVGWMSMVAWADSHASLVEVFDTDPPVEEVELVVRVHAEGFSVLGAEAALGQAGAHLSCGDCGRTRDWNTEGLTRLLGVVKDRHPDIEHIVVVPAPDVPYDLLMATMDACRNDGPRVLFPNALITGEAVPDLAFDAPAD